VISELERLGWVVRTVWECELNSEDWMREIMRVTGRTVGSE
jgi:G:T-mismatch repair DNA endonuclease (very short patch repair protein)